MFTVSKEIEFDAGHRVPNHESKCKNPHGHRYKVQITVGSRELCDRRGDSEEGMVIDFGFLKTLLMERVHDVFDHGFIVYDQDLDMLVALGEYNLPDDYHEGGRVRHDRGEQNRYGWKVIVVPWIPTAENLAKAVYEELYLDVVQRNMILAGVLVWETPTSIASYIPTQE